MKNKLIKFLGGYTREEYEFLRGYCKSNKEIIKVQERLLDINENLQKHYEEMAVTLNESKALDTKSIEKYGESLQQVIDVMRDYIVDKGKKNE